MFILFSFNQLLDIFGTLINYLIWLPYSIICPIFPQRNLYHIEGNEFESNKIRYCAFLYISKK